MGVRFSFWRAIQRAIASGRLPPIPARGLGICCRRSLDAIHEEQQAREGRRDSGKGWRLLT